MFSTDSPSPEGAIDLTDTPADLVFRAIDGRGVVFRTRDLYAAAGLEYEPKPRPGEGGTSYRKRFEGGRREFMTIIAKVKRALGEQRKVDLRATGAGSYEIVPHDRHVHVAQQDMLRGVRKVIGEGFRRLEAFDVTKASAAQRAEHMNALARADALRAVSGGRRRG